MGKYIFYLFGERRKAFKRRRCPFDDQRDEALCFKQQGILSGIATRGGGVHSFIFNVPQATHWVSWLKGVKVNGVGEQPTKALTP